MNISQLSYRLYMEDWKNSHGIDRKGEMQEMIWFYKWKDAEDEDMSYEDYIEEFGYGGCGQLYVCFDEFLGAEYRDIGYIEYLLGDDELIREYRRDLVERAKGEIDHVA